MEQGWVTVLLAFLGVIQTIALAVIADRSRRVRRSDRPPAGEAPAAGYGRRSTDRRLEVTLPSGTIESVQQGSRRGFAQEAEHVDIQVVRSPE
jgi:hypothetical protein